MLESNKIYNMECIKGMETIKDKSADMILADLPYGITNCEWDRRLDLNLFWEQANRVIKGNGAMVLTATCKFAVDLINSNRKYFRYDLVWKNTMPVGFAQSKKMPLRDRELILIFYERLPTYNPQGLIEIEDKFTKARKRTDKEFVYCHKFLHKPYISKYKNYPRSVLKFSNRNNGSLIT